MAKRLTQITVDKVKPSTKRIEIADAARPGLYLVVQPSGRKSWAFRYRRTSDRKSRKLTFPFVSIMEAHKLAQDALAKVVAGGDPASKSGEGSKLFGDVYQQFVIWYVDAKNKPSTASETKRILLKDAVAYWGNRDIRSIGRADILDALDRIADRGGPIAANRYLACVRRIFNWAIERGLIEKSPTAGIKKPASETPRERVLGDDEVRRVLAATDAIGYPFGAVVQLLLLTGQRLGEVSGMRWDELDLDKREWHLPAERTKNRKPHIVPLSAGVLEIINRVPRVDTRFVFSARTGKSISGFSVVKAKIDEASGVSGWTLHDLRRTAASGMQRLGVSSEVVDKALNHVSGSFAGIKGVYQRHDFADEKRKALEAWASFILAEPASNVVALVRP